MNPYVLSCCSTADLSEEHFKKRNIEYVCFHFSLDGKEYFDDLGKSIPYHEFYQAMLDGAKTTTSQVSVGEFIDYFEPFLKEGKDIIHLSLTSGISGVINSAVTAQKILQEKYPERKIYILDSLNASSGIGLYMDKLADLRDEGMSIDDLYEWAKHHKLNIHSWLYCTDLTFYIRGGRISKVSGAIGTILNVCPIITLNKEGKLICPEKIRGQKKASHHIINKMEKYAFEGKNYSGKCYMCQSDAMENAIKTAKEVENAFPNLDGKVEINNIGTTIGSHTGPGTVCIFFWGIERDY